MIATKGRYGQKSGSLSSVHTKTHVKAIATKQQASVTLSCQASAPIARTACKNQYRTSSASYVANSYCPIHSSCRLSKLRGARCRRIWIRAPHVDHAARGPPNRPAASRYRREMTTNVRCRGSIAHGSTTSQKEYSRPSLPLSMDFVNCGCAESEWRLDAVGDGQTPPAGSDAPRNVLSRDPFSWIPNLLVARADGGGACIAAINHKSHQPAISAPRNISTARIYPFVVGQMASSNVRSAMYGCQSEVQCFDAYGPSRLSCARLGCHSGAARRRRRRSAGAEFLVRDARQQDEVDECRRARLHRPGRGRGFHSGTAGVHRSVPAARTDGRLPAGRPRQQAWLPIRPGEHLVRPS